MISSINHWLSNTMSHKSLVGHPMMIPLISNANLNASQRFGLRQLRRCFSPVPWHLFSMWPGSMRQSMDQVLQHKINIWGFPDMSYPLYRWMVSFHGKIPISYGWWLGVTLWLRRFLHISQLVSCNNSSQYMEKKHQDGPNHQPEKKAPFPVTPWDHKPGADCLIFAPRAAKFRLSRWLYPCEKTE